MGPWAQVTPFGVPSAPQSKSPCTTNTILQIQRVVVAIPIGFTFPEGLAPLDLALKSNMRLVKELKAFNAEAATQRPLAVDHDAKRRDYCGGASNSWQWQRR